jgi:hypothetical protein
MDDPGLGRHPTVRFHPEPFMKRRVITLPPATVASAVALPSVPLILETESVSPVKGGLSAPANLDFVRLAADSDPFVL